jgi:murein DD-endopeptidase MepM/ murein hydrolase activator NlpD
VLFASPIDAAPYLTAFYGAYVDQAAGGGRRDYACGGKTYDGHSGTDLLLKNFTVQDSGVRVVAAAAGRVTHVEDGFGDRSTTAGLGGFGNHVVVEHAPRLATVYAHLRRGSIAVAVGDEVSVGNTLGLVGSSGNSNWPHLHFEVRDVGSSLDPFLGPCNVGPGHWLEQADYQDTVMVLDGDITLDGLSSLRALLERPASVGALRGDEAAVAIWVQLLNAPRTAVRFDVTDLLGRLHASVEQNSGGTFSIWYSILTLPVAGSLTASGRWTVEFFLAGEQRWVGGFEVAGTATSTSPSEADRAGRPTMRVWNPLPGHAGSVGPLE